MSSLSLVIIAKIPPTEIKRPKIWNLLVFSILNKKQSKIIIAGIAVLKRDALITWVWTKDKYVKELNKPTLVNPKKNNKGKLIIRKLFNKIRQNPRKFISKEQLFADKYRAISDFISGMTDRYAINLYNNIKWIFLINI